jgi:ribonuclease HI
MSYKAFFDGSCFLNFCGIGYMIRDPDGSSVCAVSKYAGRGDPLKAEYLALMALLERLASLSVDDAVIHGDSRTVIGQVSGQIMTRKNNRFREVIMTTRDFLREHPGWHLKWIPRAENGHADALATEGLSEVRTSR